MSKAIMISNVVYGELKKLKEEKNISFTEVLEEFIDERKTKKAGDLLKFAGLLKDDKEYDGLAKINKKIWKKFGNL